MHKENSVLIILEVLLLSLLITNIFFARIFNNVLIFLLLLLGIFIYGKLTYGKGRTKRKSSISTINNANMFTIVSCLLFMIIFYFLGIDKGFDINYSAIYRGYVSIFNILCSISIYIMIEFIRNIYVVEKSYKKLDKITNVLLTISFVLCDVLLSTKSLSFNGSVQLFNMIAIVIIGSIFKNITLNYINLKCGLKPCLIYILIMNIYIYFVPITPKINMFIEALLYIIFPYILLSVIKSIVEGKSMKEKFEGRKLKNIIPEVIITIIIISIIYLVSGEFTYSIKAIGSESMTGTINKGDAIIYKKYDINEYKIKEGDIIVYEHDGVTFIHRVKSMKTIDGVKSYITKGDANKYQDAWSITDQDIIGIYKVRILWIGYPAVFLSELM